MKIIVFLITGFLIMSLPAYAYAEEEMGSMMGGERMMEGQHLMKHDTMMEHDSMMKQGQLKAEALLYDGQGIKIGNVLFSQEDNGVKVSVEINNMPEGIYALHIHEKGQCDAPDFKSSGGHFNPYGKEHGFLNQKGPHAGDLPNIEVEEDGKGRMTVTTNNVTLRKGEINSLFKNGGTAVIIHQGPDDYISNPAGKGGPRIACGIIKEMKK